MKAYFGNYALTADEHQFSLLKVSTVKNEESENYGKEQLQIVGYYPKLSQVIDKLFHLELAKSDAATLSEIEKVMRATRKLVDTAGFTKADFK